MKNYGPSVLGGAVPQSKQKVFNPDLGDHEEIFKPGDEAKSKTMKILEKLEWPVDVTEEQKKRFIETYKQTTYHKVHSREAEFASFHIKRWVHAYKEWTEANKAYNEALASKDFKVEARETHEFAHRSTQLTDIKARWERATQDLKTVTALRDPNTVSAARFDTFYKYAQEIIDWEVKYDFRPFYTVEDVYSGRLDKQYEFYLTENAKAVKSNGFPIYNMRYYDDRSGSPSTLIIWNWSKSIKENLYNLFNFPHYHTLQKHNRVFTFDLLHPNAAWVLGDWQGGMGWSWKARFMGLCFPYHYPTEVPDIRKFTQGSVTRALKTKNVFFTYGTSFHVGPHLGWSLVFAVILAAWEVNHTTIPRRKLNREVQRSISLRAYDTWDYDVDNVYPELVKDRSTDHSFTKPVTRTEWDPTHDIHAH